MRLAVVPIGQGHTWLALGARLGRLVSSWAMLVAGSGSSGVLPGLVRGWLAWCEVGWPGAMMVRARGVLGWSARDIVRR